MSSSHISVWPTNDPAEVGRARRMTTGGRPPQLRVPILEDDRSSSDEDVSDSNLETVGT